MSGHDLRVDVIEWSLTAIACLFLACAAVLLVVGAGWAVGSMWRAARRR